MCAAVGLTKAAPPPSGRLLFWGGWGLPVSLWQPWLDKCRQQFDVIEIELDSEASFDRFVEQQLDLVRPGDALAGWSLGGAVASAVAARSGSQISHLLLLGCSPCFVIGDDWPFGMAAGTMSTFSRMLDEDPHVLKDRFAYLVTQNSTDQRAEMKLLKRKVPIWPYSQAVLSNTLKWLIKTDLRKRWQSLECPVTHVIFAADALVNVEQKQWIHECLPNHHLITISDCAHLPRVIQQESLLPVPSMAVSGSLL